MAGAPLSLESRNKRVGALMALLVAAMLGLGFAAVPLYNAFCRATGFAGTTQVASLSDAALAEQMAKSGALPPISIRFDGNVERGMPWRFGPERTTHQVRIGQRDMAIYHARNLADRAITGTASYNVEPEQAGRYFTKIQCFCFTQQTLQPGEDVRMPVVFYVDPKALDDPEMKGVEQITLSYTFHEAKAPQAR